MYHANVFIAESLYDLCTSMRHRGIRWSCVLLICQIRVWLERVSATAWCCGVAVLFMTSREVPQLALTCLMVLTSVFLRKDYCIFIGVSLFLGFKSDVTVGNSAAGEFTINQQVGETTYDSDQWNQQDPWQEWVKTPNTRLTLQQLYSMKYICVQYAYTVYGF